MDSSTGWGRYSKSLVSELDKHFDLSVSTDLGDPLKVLSLKHPLSTLDSLRSLSDSIQRVNPDGILSLISYPYASIVYLATRVRKIPYFICCHGTYAIKPLYRYASKLLAAPALSHAAHLFPVSSFTAERMRNKLPDTNNITVVTNGLDHHHFPPAASFDVDHRVLLTVGPFKPRKGQLLGVKAFAQISSSFPGLEYHFVGNKGGSYYEKVRSCVSEYGLDDRVHFEGFVSEENLRRWYETSDVYLFPAQYVNHSFEGFGLVLLEANWYGTPTVGTYTSGAVDAIADRSSGLLVEPSPNEIAHSLTELLGNDELYKSLSNGAVKWARSHTWSNSVSKLVSKIDDHT